MSFGIGQNKVRQSEGPAVNEMVPSGLPGLFRISSPVNNFCFVTGSQGIKNQPGRCYQAEKFGYRNIFLAEFRDKKTIIPFPADKALKKKKRIPQPEFILGWKPAFRNPDCIPFQAILDDGMARVRRIISTKKTDSHFLLKNITPYHCLSMVSIGEVLQNF